MRNDHFADFVKFHSANEHIYREIKRIILLKKASGFSRWSVDLVICELRYRPETKVYKTNSYKVSSNFKGFYSALLIADCPELSEFLESRKKSADNYTEEIKALLKKGQFELNLSNQ